MFVLLFTCILLSEQPLSEDVVGNVTINQRCSMDFTSHQQHSLLVSTGALINESVDASGSPKLLSNAQESLDFTSVPTCKTESVSVHRHHQHILSSEAQMKESRDVSDPTMSSSNAKESFDCTCAPTSEADPGGNDSSFQMDITCNSTLGGMHSFPVPFSSTNSLVSDDSQSEHLSTPCGSVTHATQQYQDSVKRDTFVHSRASLIQNTILENNCSTSKPASTSQLKQNKFSRFTDVSAQEISQPELDLTCEIEPVGSIINHINCTFEKRLVSSTTAIEPSVVSFGVEPEKCGSWLYNASPKRVILDNSILDTTTRASPMELLELSSLSVSTKNFLPVSTLTLDTPQKDSVSSDVHSTQFPVPHNINSNKLPYSNMSHMLSKLQQNFDAVEITIGTPEAVVLSSTLPVDNTIKDLDSANSTSNVGEKSAVLSPSALAKFGEFLNCDQTVNETCISSPLLIQNSLSKMEEHHQRPDFYHSLTQVKSK